MEAGTADSNLVLDGRKQLVSDLWLDQPDALEQIGRRVAASELDEADAQRLRQFTEEGWTSVTIDLDDARAASVLDDVERLWRERPFDVTAAGRQGRLTSMEDLDPAERRIGARIADPHSASPVLLDLMLDPEVFRVVELILGQPPVAFQSLWFDFGSVQSLHRDPMFVQTHPASHLVAAWIAVEDIEPTSGPLLYVPGSHRMPWFEFSPGQVVAHGTGPALRRAWAEERADRIAEMGVEPQPFLARRGEVFLWHAGLLHGGAPVEDESTTRRSFVVHFSSAATYTSRSASMQARVVPGDDSRWRTVRATTSEVHEKDGRRAIRSPLHGAQRGTPSAGGTAGRMATRAPLDIVRRVRRRLRAR